jgi:2-dehydro-3-deoxyphosphooctonate aldolase (KDO 8-P synthase)
MSGGVDVGPVRVGGGAPLVAICGPCQMETFDHTMRMAEAVRTAGFVAGVPVIFKASFDKANRTSLSGARGVGITDGLRWLRAVRARVGIPVVTDVHETWQVAAVAEAVDMLQIPALLCRQTDLLVEAGASGLPVMIKKGQFMAAEGMAGAVEKVESGGGDGGVLLCERGSSWGPGRLVVDMTGLEVLRGLGVPVVFDATHSVQRPGALGSESGGERQHVAGLARAAVAVGVDAVFLEVHNRPDAAPSDGPCMLPLVGLAGLLRGLRELDQTRREMFG